MADENICGFIRKFTKPRIWTMGKAPGIRQGHFEVRYLVKMGRCLIEKRGDSLEKVLKLAFIHLCTPVRICQEKLFGYLKKSAVALGKNGGLELNDNNRRRNCPLKKAGGKKRQQK